MYHAVAVRAYERQIRQFGDGGTLIITQGNGVVTFNEMLAQAPIDGAEIKIADLTSDSPVLPHREFLLLSDQPAISLSDSVNARQDLPLRGLFFYVSVNSAFQLPTCSAPIKNPISMSVRRDMPRQMTIFPGGRSPARFR